MRKFVLTAFAFLLVSSVFATSNNPNAHTWHTISVANGSWLATLSMISQPQWGHFVEADDVTEITTPFLVNSENSHKFGWTYTGPGKDFDIAYTVSLVQQKNSPNFSSKACVFVVTATQPRHPDITVIPKNGALCSWVDTGIGEDYHAE